jgi:hypothetical protein
MGFDSLCKFLMNYEAKDRTTMSKILVAYSTNSGQPQRWPKPWQPNLPRPGTPSMCDPERRPIRERYDAVVLGAPMILGWHDPARRFVRKHQAELAARRTALFACAMRLTRASRETLPPVPLALDETLVADEVKPGSLNIKERFNHHRVLPQINAAIGRESGQRGIFQRQAGDVPPEMWQAAFVMVVVQATPGDYRDWDAIRSWESLWEHSFDIPAVWLYCSIAGPQKPPEAKSL